MSFSSWNYRFQSSSYEGICCPLFTIDDRLGLIVKVLRDYPKPIMWFISEENINRTEIKGSYKEPVRTSLRQDEWLEGPSLYTIAPEATSHAPPPSTRAPVTWEHPAHNSTTSHNICNHLSLGPTYTQRSFWAVPVFTRGIDCLHLEEEGPPEA